eukprot:86159-Pelagomonas_calceolata.AAC.2
MLTHAAALIENSCHAHMPIQPWSCRHLEPQTFLAVRGYQIPCSYITMNLPSLSACAMLLCACSDGKAIIWDTETLEPCMTLEGHKGAVYSCAVNEEGTSIVTGAAEGLCCWQQQQQQQQQI